MGKNFQPHKTPEEKAIRRIKYWLIITCRKDIPRDIALVYRDWTCNKVLMIINREANPIPKWRNSQYKIKKEANNII
jgi:hypothetical protein